MKGRGSLADFFDCHFEVNSIKECQMEKFLTVGNLQFTKEIPQIS